VYNRQQERDLQMTEFGSQDWVISKITKVRHNFWNGVENAVARSRRLPASESITFNPRTWACVLNCLVLDEMQAAFDGVRGSGFDKRNGTVYHHFGDCVFWYKQLDDEGFPSNYPTETALELMQGRFMFMPKQILLVVGFQLDPVTHAVKSVEIQRYSSNRTVQFYIRLEKIEAKSRVVQMPQHTGDSAKTDQLVTTKTRIRIKRGPEQKDLNAQGNE
jgi:hypothetical protein